MEREENKAGGIDERSSAMQMVKIQIPDQADRAKALEKLLSLCRVDCFRDNIFIIPEMAVQLLNDLGVRYQELGRE